MIRRRLFNIASVVTLVLLLGGIWVILRPTDLSLRWIEHGPTDVAHALEYDRGFISFYNRDLPNPAQLAAALHRLSTAKHYDFPADWVEPKGWGTPGTEKDFGVLKFDHGDLTLDPISMSTELSSGVVCGATSRVDLSVWFLLVLFSILPSLGGGRKLMSRLCRPQPGACPKCAYNLTGNTSGTCPECGTPVPSKPEAVA